jgi:NAD(P)-dependent dehydrogenase (short-subunit alcohol dehydrogenase family)
MKTAIIIGASRGLGLGLAQELTKRGWQVVATQRSPDGGTGGGGRRDGGKCRYR